MNIDMMAQERIDELEQQVLDDAVIIDLQRETIREYEDLIRVLKGQLSLPERIAVWKTA